MGHAVVHCSFHDKIFSLLCFVLFVCVLSILGRWLQRLRADIRGQEVQWNWVHDVKLTKNHVSPA